MDSSGSTYVAWIALGVYLLSFLPMGFFFFYIGFLFFLNPLCHTVPQSDYKTVLGGISGSPTRSCSSIWWLSACAAPHGGGVGDHLPWMRLCAAPCIIHPVQLPAYLLWLGSMALVVCGSLLRQERADKMNNRSGHAEVEPDLFEHVDGKSISKSGVERMMKLYDELP